MVLGQTHRNSPLEQSIQNLDEITASYCTLLLAVRFAAGRGNALQFCVGSPLEILIVTGRAERLPRNQELPSAAAFPVLAASPA